MRDVERGIHMEVKYSAKSSHKLNDGKRNQTLCKSNVYKPLLLAYCVSFIFVVY